MGAHKNFVAAIIVLGVYGGFAVMMAGIFAYSQNKSTGECPNDCFRANCCIYEKWADDEGYIAGPCQCTHANSDGSSTVSCAQYTQHFVLIHKYYIMIVVGSVVFSISLTFVCLFGDKIEAREREIELMSSMYVESPLHVDYTTKCKTEQPRTDDIESSVYSPIHLDILPANTPLPRID